MSVQFASVSRVALAAAAWAILVAGVPAAGASTNTYAVPAQRERLTTDATSPVVHDNEVMALAAHSGRLFAATDQWEYSGPNARGQVLVKDSPRARWRVFEDTQSLRVQAIDSFSIPRDQGLGAGHSLLVTQAIVDGHSRIQWLLDGSDSFTGSYTLASTAAGARSFGAHEDNGVWSIYAGVEPTGVLRGTWSSSSHTLRFDPAPELTGAATGERGTKTRKVTGFADCAGALYATINTKLYRRNDGDLVNGIPRWALVYEAPPVGAHNSGLRGLSCTTHDGADALLVSTEGSGDVWRFDDLPRGHVGQDVPPLVPTLEFSPVDAIRPMLAAGGTDVPPIGDGSIAYVIAAYNNFEPLTIDGTRHLLFGFEWGYARSCPSTRTCGPTAFGAVTYDAAACFAVRTDSTGTPAYSLRCLSGPDLSPSQPVTDPIRSGQAFVSIRSIKESPFGDGRLYYGGYDCNFAPADGTAWIASSVRRALHLDVTAKETTS